MKSFREHVTSLPLAEQQAVRQAERQWVQAHYAGVASDPAQRDFDESFLGYSDPPAGKPTDYFDPTSDVRILVGGRPLFTPRE